MLETAACIATKWLERPLRTEQAVCHVGARIPQVSRNRPRPLKSVSWKTEREEVCFDLPGSSSAPEHLLASADDFGTKSRSLISGWPGPREIRRAVAFLRSSIPMLVGS